MTPYPPAYHEGIVLFNAGHYWHAHEQWEACWLATSGDEARFYKAIIQAAAALVKWQRGSRRGLELNWAKSRKLLLTLPGHYNGLDLIALREALDRFVADGAAAPPQLELADRGATWGQ
jgi:predicted metal-dependent hydrolase